MHPFCSRLVLLSTLAAAHAEGAQTVALPAWVCTHPDAVFAGGFEAGQNAIPSNPSQGSGGAYPGTKTRHLHITGLGSGTQTYFLYLPSNYTPVRSWPLVLALHGVAPNDGGSYAANLRDTWAMVAATAGFVVAAPVADEVVNVGGQSGITWSVPPSSGPTDYDLFAAVRADVESAYNIERTRRYGWGFSAGAHVMHDLGVNQYSAAFNASTMAAYGVDGGDLGLACSGLNDIQCSQLLAALPRKIPVDIHIGTLDPNYANAQSDAVRFLAQGWITGQTFFWTAISGGVHDYSAIDLQQVWTNLCPNAVVP